MLCLPLAQLLRVDLVSLYVPVLVACFGGYLYLRGSVSVGEIVAYVGLLAYVQCGFSAFTNTYEEWTKARPHLEASEDLEVLLLDFDQVCRLCDDPEASIDAKAWTVLYLYQKLGRLA